jgi:hypothetical protein
MNYVFGPSVDVGGLGGVITVVELATGPVNGTVAGAGTVAIGVDGNTGSDVPPGGVVGGDTGGVTGRSGSFFSR